MSDVCVAFLSTPRLSIQTFTKVLEENEIKFLFTGIGTALVETSIGLRYRVYPVCVARMRVEQVMKAYRLACLCGVPFVSLEGSCKSRANVL